MTLSRSCQGGQKPSKGNTCLDPDWFLFMGAVIKWLRHPHYPEMKLKDQGRAPPSVWLLWSRSVCTLATREHVSQFTPRTTHQSGSKVHPPVMGPFGVVGKPKNRDEEERSDYLPPTCCCTALVLTTTLGAAKPGPQLMTLSKVCARNTYLKS